MQLKIGTYALPASGVAVASTRELVRGGDGIPWKFVDKLMCDGYLEGSGQAALTAAQFEFERVLLRPYQDIILYRDDGSASATALTNAGSITGVVVTQGPSFQDVKGPEYVTQRHFTFTAEADYYCLGVNGNTLTEFTETITISGGGPLYRCMPALTGPSQRQLIYELTPCVATQKGSATGAKGYPSIPPPLWPFALDNNRDDELTSPLKQGKSYTGYRRSWAYSFSWPYPLMAFPNRWK